MIYVTCSGEIGNKSQGTSVQFACTVAGINMNNIPLDAFNQTEH